MTQYYENLIIQVVPFLKKSKIVRGCILPQSKIVVCGVNMLDMLCKLHSGYKCSGPSLIL